MIAALMRELWIGTRRGAPYAALAVNAVLLACLTAVALALAGSISPWLAPPIGSTSSAGQTGIVATLIAWRGSALFLLLALWSLGLVVFLGPAVGARSIAGDRATGALDTLVASGTSGLGIVAAKALAAYGEVCLVLTGSAPAFAIVWMFGGVGASTVVATVAILLAVAALGVVLGMTAAIFVRGVVASIVVGCLAALALLLGSVAVTLPPLLAARGATPPTVLLVSPLLGFLTAMPDLTAALLASVPDAPELPLRSGANLLGRTLELPVALLIAVLHVVLASALLPVVAAGLDPYHPIRTTRLRRRIAGRGM